MISSKPLPLWALLLAPLVGGCWAFTSKDEGDKLRTDLKALQSRVDALDQRDADLNQATRDAKEQVAKLKTILEEATDLSTRNSADFGLQVQKVQQDLVVLSGKFDELSHNLERSKEATAATGTPGAVGTPGAAAPAKPADKESLFRDAKAKLDAGDSEEARKLFRQFLNQYPQDAHAPEAQLLYGESYYQQKKYAAAIGELQKVIDNYPKSPAVESAMYKIGLAFLELRYCSDAKTFLGETLKRYPKSSHQKDIQSALGTITKNAKNRKLCTN